MQKAEVCHSTMHEFLVEAVNIFIERKGCMNFLIIMNIYDLTIETKTAASHEVNYSSIRNHDVLMFSSFKHSAISEPFEGFVSSGNIFPARCTYLCPFFDGDH